MNDKMIFDNIEIGITNINIDLLNFAALNEMYGDYSDYFHKSFSNSFIQQF